ncbi:hypothetical protein PPTG_06998 [Phytophthora nicotianae INRA-310]|uniref:PiggyBac transposable element-derived protein domain-containing protein n=1 Tax=Phytophthora nicotianae (strain INRA-310) TaxID=761204 RepID=W2QRT3_PHYN3|nr:hypothetical protein PPTG_06998 [Phytophthora nicotianae INRA-310]ETN15803.1 hypothetical protein PPTG_06998 [Phytophthora nicotianae INRA-310]
MSPTLATTGSADTALVLTGPVTAETTASTATGAVTASLASAATSSPTASKAAKTITGPVGTGMTATAALTVKSATVEVTAGLAVTAATTEDLACGYGSEEASNDESDDEMELPEPMCYVNEVDSSDSEDGDVDVSFDINCCSDAPSDYYTGSWGPTRRCAPVRSHELVHAIGLLISSSLCLMRDGVAKHWSTTEDGSVPHGTWGRYVKRSRYEDIIRFIHFNDNGTLTFFTTRLGRSETTFRRGYRLARTISFDEGLKRTVAKSKWLKGMLVRHVRNLSKVLCGQNEKRLVMTDNYYSWVALLLKLLSIGLYHVGTVRTNKLGWCKSIQYSQKKRPMHIARGSYRIAQCTSHPELVALSWMDSRPDYKRPL